MANSFSRVSLSGARPRPRCQRPGMGGDHDLRPAPAPLAVHESLPLPERQPLHPGESRGAAHNQGLRPRPDSRDLARTSYRHLPPQGPQWPQLSFASSPKPRERTVPSGNGRRQGRGAGWTTFCGALRTPPEWLIPWISGGRCSAGTKASVGGVSARGPGERDVSLSTAAMIPCAL